MARLERAFVHVQCKYWYKENTMKRLLVITALALASATVSAQHRSHGHNPRPHHYHGHGNWVAPLVLGGVIGYAVTRNNEPVIIQQPPVIIQQPQMITNYPICSVWVETLQPDGSIVRQRTCTQ